MTMVNCMVKSCKNRGKIPGITYHQIPRYYAKEWLKALNRKSNETISLRNVVCSQHFRTEDFKGGKHMYLKPGAVPSIHLGEICSNNEETDNSGLDSSTCQESTLAETENFAYTLSSNTDSSLCPGSLSEVVKNNQTVSAYDLMYEYCSQKERDPLGDDEQSLVESSHSEKSEDSTEMRKKISTILDYNEDLQEDNIVNESSDNEKSEESTEIQKKIIKEFHDYSITPGRRGRLAAQRTIKSIRKKLKAAQQKQRRLERRVVRLKDIVEELKQKNV